jgi:glycosyltransferase involved in cell wall biosynthesis
MLANNLAEGDTATPFVSVVIPVLNEERHIAACLESVLNQHYPRHRMEVIVADGGSADRTRDIVVDLAARDSRVRMLDNPRRSQAAGLNLAISASRGDVVARLDGHAAWAPEHLARCVRLLERTGADNVGGTMNAVGETAVGEAVARATRSPWAVGGALYRYGTAETEAATVWLGCFRRSALERVGPFDERFPPHEDYELNHRIRTTGGRIVYSPDLPTRYWVRSSWGALAKQFFLYGRAKARVARHTSGVVRPYHLLPLAFTAVAVAGTVAVAFGHARRAAIAGTALYGASCLAASIPVGRGASAAVRARIPFVFCVVHLCWGAGFWEGVREAIVNAAAGAPSPAETREGG